MEFAHLNISGCDVVTLVGPMMYSGVFKAYVLEQCTVDGRFEPSLAVGVVCALITRGFVKGFDPLVHLNYPAQTVGVLSCDAEFTIK